MLIVFLSSRISPCASTVILCRKIALGDGGGDAGDVTHLVGEVAGHVIDRFGQIAPRSGDAFHFGLATELTFGTDFARHAGDFAAKALSWSTMVLMVFFSSRISPRTRP